MPTPPPLQLSPPDAQAFIDDAPTPASRAPSSAATQPTGPRRGHVLQASGKLVRRLVVNVPPNIGAELDRRSPASGASLSRVTADLLRRLLER